MPSHDIRPDFDLNLLGEVCLLRKGVTVKVPSQKALCMLAYTVLSQHCRAGIPDLLDLLWPSSIETRARHSISQLLYALKRRCGGVELLGREGDFLKANTDALRCDVSEFDKHTREANWPLALMTYGGPFLQGIDIAADVRFEHWRDATDARLNRGFRYVVDRMAAMAEAEDPKRLETWTRQALLILPSHTPLASLHFRAIADQGRYDEAEHGLSTYLHTHLADVTRAEQDEIAAQAIGVAAAKERAVLRLGTAETASKFVGRADELAQLRALWSEAIKGVARAAIIAGDPGVGKTRLLDQFAKFAVLRNGKVLIAPSSPATAQIAFGGIRDLFIDEVRSRASSGESKFPELHKLVENVARAGADPPESVLFAECERLIRTLSLDRPVLLAIDDLQWLDKSSLRAIVYVAYRCQTERLCVVMCTRPEGEQTGERFRGVVKTSFVRLEPMVESSAEALLDAYCATHGAGVTPEAKQTLLARAAGNPFFLRTLVDDWLRKTSMPAEYQRSALPESITSLIISRTRQLTAGAQDALRSLAVLRTEEPIEVIARVVRRSAVRTARAIEELVRMRLVSDGGGGVSIAHDIIADVVYASIPSSVRRYLHRNAALALGERGPAVVAEHAHRARDWTLAFPSAMQAAGNASRMGAYSEAEFFFKVAQAAASDEQKSEVAAAYLTFSCGLDRFSRGMEGVANARRHFMQVHDTAGLLRCDAVELDANIQDGLRPLDSLIAEALELVRRAGEIGSPRLSAEMVSVLYRAVELGSVDSLSSGWLSEAITIAERTDVDWKVTLLGKAAVFSYFATGPEQAQELAYRLPLLAGDDVRLRALSDVYVGITLMFLGRLFEAEQYFQDALRLARDPALTDAFYKANMNLALLETDMGRYESARRRLSERADGGKATAILLANRGFLCLETGDLEGTEHASNELRPRAAKLNAPLLLIAASTLDGSAALERQEYSRATHEANQVAALLDRVPFQSDDSYARILMARIRGLQDPRHALEILRQPIRRAAVPQLRIELETAVQLMRIEPESGLAALAGVRDAALAMGAAPIASRAEAKMSARLRLA